MRAPAHVIRARQREEACRDGHRARQHRGFIASLRCLACGKPPPSECARLCPVAPREPSEFDLLPLCGPDTVWEDCCHSRMYFAGPARFWSALGVDAFGLARRLWIVSGDQQAGEWLIREARPRIAAAPARVPGGAVKARSPEPIPATTAP